MNKVALCVIWLLVTISSALAQTAAPDAAELTKLLNDILAGASRNDPAAHERFWADDLIYTRSAGRRTNKAEIMHDLRSAPAPKPDDPKTITRPRTFAFSSTATQRSSRFVSSPRQKPPPRDKFRTCSTAARL